MNNFYRSSNLDLLNVSHTAATTAGTAPASYGLTTAQVAALNSDNAALAAAVLAQASAKADYEAATAAKDAARATLIGTLSGATKSAYADPAVDDVKLRSLGFSPRPSGGSRPTALLAPTDLVAGAFADGTVRLAWGRNGSRQGTMFVVETSADGLAWTFLTNTTRTSLLAEPFAPGVAAWFRVTATTSTLRSPASNPASVYAPSAPAAVQLRVA